VLQLITQCKRAIQQVSEFPVLRTFRKQLPRGFMFSSRRESSDLALD
jgi:hypothetical protein